MKTENIIWVAAAVVAVAFLISATVVEVFSQDPAVACAEACGSGRMRSFSRSDGCACVGEP